MLETHHVNVSTLDNVVPIDDYLEQAIGFQSAYSFASCNPPRYYNNQVNASKMNLCSTYNISDQLLFVRVVLYHWPSAHGCKKRRLYKV